MNILSIVEAQTKKNYSIQIKSELPEYKLWVRKHLELNVKLGAVAEETKCYNYHENKELDLNRNVLFTKYIDLFSCVINFGIAKEYFSNYEVNASRKDNCLSNQFLNLYIDINDLIVSSCSDNFFTLVEDTLSLGLTLGYSEEDILNSFASID